MNRELKLIEYTCDCCRKTKTVQKVQYDYKLPEGWGLMPVHDCGMTGYTKWEELCPECLSKEK